VRLNLTDPLSVPVVNYGTGSNPIDFDVYLAHSKYLRRMLTTPTMQGFGAAEVNPGASVQSDAALLEYIKSTMTLSFMHPCCTAGMMPKNKGGVVGADLKVHGAAGLRVVVMSVLPFLPSSHLSSLAYAVGEKVSGLLFHSWDPPEFSTKVWLTNKLGRQHHHARLVKSGRKVGGSESFSAESHSERARYQFVPLRYGGLAMVGHHAASIPLPENKMVIRGSLWLRQKTTLEEQIALERMRRKLSLY
jgi:hypothetical protein